MTHQASSYHPENLNNPIVTKNVYPPTYLQYNPNHNNNNMVSQAPL